MLNPRVEESGHKCIQFFAVWGLVLTLIVAAIVFWPSVQAESAAPVEYQDGVSEQCIALLTDQVVEPCSDDSSEKHSPRPVAPETTFKEIEEFHTHKQP